VGQIKSNAYALFAILKHFLRSILWNVIQELPMRLRYCFLMLALCLPPKGAHSQTVFAAGPPAPIDGQYPWFGRQIFSTPSVTHAEVASIPGVVIAIDADDYSIKTDSGRTFIVHSTLATQFVRRTTNNTTVGSGKDEKAGSNASEQSLTRRAIHMGDYVIATGMATGKSIRTIRIMQLDPEGVKTIRQLRDTYGKTWLMGSITRISHDKVKLKGILDFPSRTFTVAKTAISGSGPETATWQDLHKGAFMRADGSLINGRFSASKIEVFGPGL